MIKNPPFDAGDVGLIPWEGTKILHAAEQLSLCATSSEPVRLKQRAVRCAAAKTPLP